MADLVYILAASHSGSTLLAMLLGAHPETCTVGELKARNLGDVDRYVCSCGERIKECEFWARVSKGMARRGIDFDVTDAHTDFRSVGSAYARRLLGPMHRGLLLERIRDAALHLSSLWRAALVETNQNNLALIETICGLSGVRIIIDSSKIALRLKYLLRIPQLNVKIIRLVRDGRGVALTYMAPGHFADAAYPALRGGGMGGTRENEALSMAEAALEWRRANEEAEHILARMEKSRWIGVRYEELCTRTDETLDRLFGFLGVDPSRAVQGFRSVGHHVIGNGMRLDSTSEVRLDERWRSVLTSHDLRVFDSVAGKMSRRHGYV